MERGDEPVVHGVSGLALDHGSSTTEMQDAEALRRRRRLPLQPCRGSGERHPPGAVLRARSPSRPAPVEDRSRPEQLHGWRRLVRACVGAADRLEQSECPGAIEGGVVHRHHHPIARPFACDVAAEERSSARRCVPPGEHPRVRVRRGHGQERERDGRRSDRSRRGSDRRPGAADGRPARGQDVRPRLRGVLLRRRSRGGDRPHGPRRADRRRERRHSCRADVPSHPASTTSRQRSRRRIGRRSRQRSLQ